MTRQVRIAGRQGRRRASRNIGVPVFAFCGLMSILCGGAMDVLCAGRFVLAAGCLAALVMSAATGWWVWPEFHNYKGLHMNSRRREFYGRHGMSVAHGPENWTCCELRGFGIWIARRILWVLDFTGFDRHDDRDLLRRLGAIEPLSIGTADVGQRVEDCSRAAARVLDASAYRDLPRPGLNVYMAGIATGFYELTSAIAVGLQGTFPDMTEMEAARWRVATLEAIYRLGYQHGRRLHSAR